VKLRRFGETPDRLPALGCAQARQPARLSAVVQLSGAQSFAIVNGAQSSMVRNRQSCAIVAARAQWTARRTTTMAIWDGPPLRVAPPFFY
jgi:hypothetical protein